MPKKKQSQEKPEKKVDSVAIVAMGASSRTYMSLASHAGGRQRVAQQTWAINSMGNVIKHDLLFHMDDCKIQEARAKADPEGNIAGLVDWLKDHPKFMTSREYKDYPGAIAFPLEDVINKIGVSYFNSTVAYAVAYAIYIGVKKISMYGVDFSYENGHKAEKGRACVEYLLGFASSLGIHIEVASDSTLLDANVEEDARFYGYDTIKPVVEKSKEGVRISFEDRETIPTAEEMEIRYNHKCQQA